MLFISLGVLFAKLVANSSVNGHNKICNYCSLIYLLCCVPFNSKPKTLPPTWYLSFASHEWHFCYSQLLPSVLLSLIIINDGCMDFWESSCLSDYLHGLNLRSEVT